MENNETPIHLQMNTREIQLYRLKKIHRTQEWLVKQLDTNRTYVSQYFNNGAFPELAERIERRIAREEQKIKERNAKSAA